MLLLAKTFWLFCTSENITGVTTYLRNIFACQDLHNGFLLVLVNHFWVLVLMNRFHMLILAKYRVFQKSNKRVYWKQYKRTSKIDKNVYFTINVGNVQRNLLYKSEIASLNLKIHVLEFFDQYFQSPVQYCLSVLQDSEARSCKRDFSISPIEKSSANLSRGCGKAASWLKSNAHWKIRIGNSWYSLTHEDEHCPAATNFCAPISLAGTQTVE